MNSSLEHVQNPDAFASEVFKQEAEALYSGEKNWYVTRGDSDEYWVEPLGLRDIHFQAKTTHDSREPKPRIISEAELKDFLITHETRIMNGDRVQGVLRALDNLRAQKALEEIKSFGT
jgi:hypothetical protein